MEEAENKGGLTLKQGLAIGAGAAAIAVVVAGGIIIGRKLKQKADEEEWGEKLKEALSDAVKVEVVMDGEEEEDAEEE